MSADMIAYYWLSVSKGGATLSAFKHTLIILQVHLKFLIALSLLLYLTCKLKRSLLVYSVIKIFCCSMSNERLRNSLYLQYYLK